MKVLQIGQLPLEAGGNYTTGAANVVYELSKKSVKGVTLFTYGTNTPEKKARRQCSYPHQYIGYRLMWYMVIIKWILHPVVTFRQWYHYYSIDHGNPLRLAFYKENIERAINIVHPDVIHVHSISNISSTFYAKNDKRIPILLTCHGIFYRGDKSDSIGRDMYLGNIGFANAYSGLTVESELEFERILGVPREKVSVIPNGVNCDKFYYDQEARQLIRKRLGVGENTKVLITVASVQNRKGQYEFIKLLKHLDIDYQYWIIGTGQDIPIIQKFIEENGLGAKIKLLGFQKSDVLFSYYSAADIYAHVSIMEGQALCEIEASATGLRTIVDKRIVGTIPDISSGDYYILDQSQVDLQNLSSWILQNTCVRESKNGLDWQNISERYAELYCQMII